MRDKVHLDFTKHLKDCEKLIQLAKTTKYPREEVEGHIYFAKFCAFARRFDDKNPEDLASRGAEHLAPARELLQKYPSTKPLESEIESANMMLRDDMFYRQVSTDEMRSVYEAMSSELHGTGHWYTCENGHPFTVGECGMPMELARCPECGETVVGGSHVPAEGVQRVEEIENLAHNADRLGV